MSVFTPIDVQDPQRKRRALMERLAQQMSQIGGMRGVASAGGRPARSLMGLRPGPRSGITQPLPQLAQALQRLLGPGGAPRPLPAEVSQARGLPAMVRGPIGAPMSSSPLAPGAGPPIPIPVPHLPPIQPSPSSPSAPAPAPPALAPTPSPTFPVNDVQPGTTFPIPEVGGTTPFPAPTGPVSPFPTNSLVGPVSPFPGLETAVIDPETLLPRGFRRR